MKRITLLCYKSSISFINSFVLSLSKPFDCIGTELTLGNPGGGGGGGGGGRSGATKVFKSGPRSFRRAISPAPD